MSTRGTKPKAEASQLRPVKEEGVKPDDCTLDDSPPGGRWFWLLAPDGSPAMANANTSNITATTTTAVTIGGTLKREDQKQPMIPAARVKSNRDSKPGSWYWLLAPDGCPAMATNPATKQETGDRPDSKLLAPDGSPAMAANPATKQETGDRPDSKLLAPDGSPATKQETGGRPDSKLLAPDGSPAMATNPATKQETGDRPDSKPGSWCWLLAPDGSPAMAANPATKQETGGRSIAAPDEVESKPGSWYWLLAPDGSFASVGTAGTTTAGKRKRGQPFANRSRRKPSSRKTPIVYYAESDDEESLSDDDENSFASENSNILNGSSSSSSNNNRYQSDTNSRKWEASFELLVEYKNKHGTTRVAPKKSKLGRWVVEQRYLYRKRALLAYRQQRLESIGFIWQSRRCYETRPWMEMYQRLVAYKKKHNNTHVPSRFKEDPRLGLWVRTQRKRCKEKNRVDLLNSIGFIWQVRPCYEIRPWMEMYQRLVAFKKKHNSTHVPIRFKEDPKLGGWVCTQRKVCKDQDRIDLLNSIGFIWKVQPCYETLPWMEMYQRLVAYKTKHNSTHVPRGFKEDPKLAEWVCTQRNSCKETNRVDLLNSIGFDWDPFRTGWMKMYRRLVAHKTKYKSTCVPAHWKEDPQLGQWVRTQQRSCKEKYRVDLLDDIGFVWDVAR